MKIQQNINKTVLLIERTLKGDINAYGELFQNFQSMIYSTVLEKLHNTNEAEDIVQEVFIHSLSKLEQLNDWYCFPGWLKKITIRLTLTRLRYRRNINKSVDKTIEFNFLDKLVYKEECEKLYNGLSYLSIKDREILDIFYFRGYSHKQISEKFKVSVGVVKHRLHDARRRLREQL